jgi:hypothetical protein
MTVARFRGREVSAADVAFIRELIASHPGASRRALSIKLCGGWGWAQPNGTLCDAVARSMLLKLHRAGEIALPEPRVRRSKPAYHRKTPDRIEVDATPICCGLSKLRPLDIRPVRRTAEEPLFNSLIETHHYLGYTQTVGAHLKYLISSAGRPLACISFGSAPRHLGARDRFIGWSPQARRRNIRFIAYNPRFLILPWVRVPYLASHILGDMARRLPGDWEAAYGNPILFLETFIDPPKYKGTCYLAANWTVLGETRGVGHKSVSKAQDRSIKRVLGYALHKRFREILRQVS